MDEEIRRFVAYAASGRIKGQFARTIYSYDQARHSHMTESYDYDTQAHLSGSRNGQLFHYGRSAHIQLKIDGERFSGFDYSSGSHFSGRVNARNVTLYDYQAAKHFQYMT